MLLNTKKIFSLEHRKKLSLSLKGNKNGFGKKCSEEKRIKISNSNRGKKLSNETKLLISKAAKGRITSDETKKKISEKMKGKIPKFIPNNKGIKRSQETKDKLRILNSGSNGNNWKGGISKNLYSVDWTKTLRISIRERDRYTCQICGNKQDNRAFPVHHIDYNKDNCNPNNLITLCSSCHTKTNYNREWWVEYFKNLISH